MNEESEFASKRWKVAHRLARQKGPGLTDCVCAYASYGNKKKKKKKKKEKKEMKIKIGK